MKVVVMGLGYVGTVCAGCLARDGVEVVGVDINKAKVAQLDSGQSPVLEPGLDDLIHQARRSGLLHATTHLGDETRDADAFLLAVGTPSAGNGSSDLSHLLRAVAEVAEAVRGVEKFQVVNVRSTTPPGTVRYKIAPLLEERSGRQVGKDIGLVMNPEFLREGTSIRDYDSALFDVCGATDDRSIEIVRALYARRNRPLHVTSLETAEMAKYANNAFHALKVAFANEMGRLARAVGVDSLEVMRLLCEDRRLNISPVYLRPGMAFGGSCLPKDLRALIYQCRKVDVAAPLLEAILSSNEIHLKAALDRILSLGRPRTAILGLSFKPSTDDLRESAMVRLVEGLLGKGVPVRIYDRNVQLSSLLGANREYIQREIPHIGTLMVGTLSEAVRDADVVVVGSDDPEMDTVSGLIREGQTLIDLFGRIAAQNRDRRPEGICW